MRSALIIAFAAAAALPASAEPRIAAPRDIVIAPRPVGAQATRAQLVADARRLRTLAAARAHWAKPGDGACYQRPMFTVYGWRTARVCMGAARISFE